MRRLTSWANQSVAPVELTKCSSADEAAARIRTAAGAVRAVGTSASSWSSGDDVLGTYGFDALVVDERLLAREPSLVDLAERSGLATVVVGDQRAGDGAAGAADLETIAANFKPQQLVEALERASARAARLRSVLADTLAGDRAGDELDGARESASGGRAQSGAESLAPHVDATADAEVTGGGIAPRNEAEPDTAAQSRTQVPTDESQLSVASQGSTPAAMGNDSSAEAASRTPNLGDGPTPDSTGDGSSDSRDRSGDGVISTSDGAVAATEHTLHDYRSRHARAGGPQPDAIDGRATAHGQPQAVAPLPANSRPTPPAVEVPSSGRASTQMLNDDAPAPSAAGVVAGAGTPTAPPRETGSSAPRRQTATHGSLAGHDAPNGTAETNQFPDSSQRQSVPAGSATNDRTAGEASAEGRVALLGADEANQHLRADEQGSAVSAASPQLANNGQHDASNSTPSWSGELAAASVHDDGQQHARSSASGLSRAVASGPAHDDAQQHQGDSLLSGGSTPTAQSTFLSDEARRVTGSFSASSVRSEGSPTEAANQRSETGAPGSPVARTSERSHRGARRPNETRASGTRSTSADGVTSGRIIAVTGKPGSGVSTTAAALAQGLADRLGVGTVLLADLSRASDQAVLHDSPDIVPGLEDLVAHERQHPDAELDLAQVTFEFKTRGYDLLLGLRRRRDWAALERTALTAAVERLRRTYRVSVCDIDDDFEGRAEGGSADVEARNAAARHLVSVADAVVTTGTPSVTGLRHLLQLVDDLRALNVEPHRIRPLLTRLPGGWQRKQHRSALAALASVGAGLTTAARSPESARAEEAHRNGTRLPRRVVGAACGVIDDLVGAPTR